MLGSVRRAGGLADLARWGSRRAVKLVGADGNPLRRGIDRMERAVWILLAIGFLAVAPMLAPMAGRAAQSTNSGQIRQEQSWREVKAVLLERAPDHYYGYSSSEAVWVRGRWRSPAGRVMTGMIPTEPGTPSGTAVPIWVDHDGRLTGRQPVTADLISARVVAIEVLAVAGLAILALLLAAGVRWLTNRRRMTYWTIEWDSFGPRWSARHLAAAGCRPPRNPRRPELAHLVRTR